MHIWEYVKSHGSPASANYIPYSSIFEFSLDVTWERLFIFSPAPTTPVYFILFYDPLLSA
jgi:hypothetical protein